MTITGHAVAAHLVQGHPAIRIVWGIVSHWILDETLHEHRPQGLHVTDPATWTEHWKWLAWQVAGPLLFVLATGDWWAIVYGMIPDIVDGVWIAINKLRGRDVWMSGDMIAHLPLPFLRTWSLTATQNVSIELLVVAVLARAAL